MKLVITILLLSILGACHNQIIPPGEMVKEIDSPYRPATILLYKEKIELDSAIQMYNGDYIYKSLEPGCYKLVFKARGQETKTIDSIIVPNGQILQLTIRSKGPCLFDYPNDYIPTCPENHTDKIIPIAYGLIIGNIDKDKKENSEPEYFPGGCMVTGCDPRYYCTIHLREF
jgi:hypothetical protein